MAFVSTAKPEPEPSLAPCKCGQELTVKNVILTEGHEREALLGLSGLQREAMA